jgi:hypothetical protein
MSSGRAWSPSDTGPRQIRLEGFNVGLIRWFELADADSIAGDGWGLLRSAYSVKPAYDVMHHAVRAHDPC